MIYDKIDNFRLYAGVHPLFINVWEFISGHGLEALHNGRNELCRGAYASVDNYVTVEESNKRIECHRKYIDIQMVLAGEELIGVCQRDACSVSEEYDSLHDVEFVEGETGNVRLNINNFIILFPHDAHRPGVFYKTPCNIRKAVFKIPA
jgi:biofilm protein TabA